MACYLTGFCRLFSLLSFAYGKKLLEERKFQVACVGDSITYGSGATDRNRTSYPPVLQVFVMNDHFACSSVFVIQTSFSFSGILQELLGEDRYEVHNFGLGSATVMKSGDYTYWYTHEFNRSIAIKPDIVIIQLGTNDAKVR